LLLENLQKCKDELSITNIYIYKANSTNSKKQMGRKEENGYHWQDKGICEKKDEEKQEKQHRYW
jgi:hypothetical protein